MVSESIVLEKVKSPAGVILTVISIISNAQGEFGRILISLTLTGMVSISSKFTDPEKNREKKCVLTRRFVGNTMSSVFSLTALIKRRAR